MIRTSIAMSAFLCFLVAITLVPTTYPAYAQGPPEKPPEEAEVESDADRKRLAEEARRAREEERRREAIDEASRAWRDEYVRMATPEEIEARLRSEVNRFNRDIVEFLRAARDVSYYRFAPLSERWALENLGEELDRMEGRVDRLLRFMTDGDSADSELTVELGQSTTAQALAILNQRAFAIGPKLTSLIGGDVLDIGLYRAVIEELFEIKALTEALQP